MAAAILSLIFFVVVIGCHVIWLVSVVNHDGKCHYSNCGHCPYDGWCPMQEEKNHDTDRKVHK